MAFTPTLLSQEPQNGLRWKGRRLLPGIFDGEHDFQRSKPSPGRVHFTQGERFSGLLVHLVFRGSMRSGTARGFEAMNHALKARAEAK